MSFNNPFQTGNLQSPNIGSTVLGNLPSIPLISPRNYFLQALESWIATPTTENNQWVVLFEDFPQILKENVIQELEPRLGGNGWNIGISKKLLCNYFLQKTIGCLLAQSYKTPRQTGEFNMSTHYKGFLGGPYLEKRQANEFLELSFLETNLSFVDNIIRPWQILVNHKGLVARPKEESVKTNIMIFEYARTNQYLSQIPRKIWTFFDCAPTQVVGSSYDYEKGGVEIKDSVQFVYNSYQVYYTTYIPIFSLIDKFNSGGVKEVLDTVIANESIRNIGNLI